MMIILPRPWISYIFIKNSISSPSHSMQRARTRVRYSDLSSHFSSLMGLSVCTVKNKNKNKKRTVPPGKKNDIEMLSEFRGLMSASTNVISLLPRVGPKRQYGPEPYAAAEGPTINKARFWKRRPSYEMRYEKITLSLPRSFNSGSKK